MSFMDTLKKTFLYTGDEKDDSQEAPKKEKSSKKLKDKRDLPGIRFDVTNPLKRVMDTKNDAVNCIKNSSICNSSVITDGTKELIYEAFYNKVESKLHKGKPLVEAKLLFKRFLDDEVTDEALYSDEDLLYIQTLVSCTRELKTSYKDYKGDSLSIIDDAIKNLYVLEMIEVYNNFYDLSLIKYLIESSYVLCGYSTNSHGVVNSIKEKVNVPYFPINIRDNIFYLLSDVKSLISDENQEEDKRHYIIDKISPFLRRYVILNNVPVRTLYPAYLIFTDWLTNKEETTANPTPSIVSCSSTTCVCTEEDRVITDTKIQNKMMEGMEKEVTPISKLKEEADLLELYADLPVDPTVEREDFESAIEHFNKEVRDGRKLSEREHQLLAVLRMKLSRLPDDGGDD